jgi:glutathione peroxidase
MISMMIAFFPALSGHFRWATKRGQLSEQGMIVGRHALPAAVGRVFGPRSAAGGRGKMAITKKEGCEQMMKFTIGSRGALFGVAILVAVVGAVLWVVRRGEAGEPPTEKSVYEFTLPDIDGKPKSLKEFSGKVLLVVNVASKCGYTGQYAGLQKLYQTYQARGLEILGFPSNDFLGQEPGTNEEVKQFCTLTYGVSFPMFGKVAVSGNEAHPLYRFLTHPATNPGSSGAITWNFNKFLISRSGKILQRFGTRTPPEDPELQKALEAALAASE